LVSPQCGHLFSVCFGDFVLGILSFQFSNPLEKQPGNWVTPSISSDPQEAFVRPAGRTVRWYSVAASAKAFAYSSGQPINCITQAELSEPRGFPGVLGLSWAGGP